MVGNPCTGNFDGTDTDLCFMNNDPTLKEYYQGHAFLSFDDAINTPTDDYGYVTSDVDAYDILERFCEWFMDGTLRRWHQPLGASLASQERSAVRYPHGALARYGPCNANWLELWLNRVDVQTALHAQVGIQWEMCSTNLSYPTYNDSKGVLSFYRDLMDNTDWNITVYSGDADTVVNFIQTQKIMISLKRRSVSQFLPWYYQDMYNASWRQLGGYYMKYDRISWASVRGAGHMVPTVAPAAAWQLLHSFLATGAPGMAPLLGPAKAISTQAPTVIVVTPAISPNVGMFVGGIGTGLMLGILGACFCHRRERHVIDKELLAQMN
jgi:hypothetical protein